MNSTSTLTAAAVNWKAQRITEIVQFYNHLTTLVEGAVARGASLVVLPEFNVLELLPLVHFRDGSELPSALLPLMTTYESAVANLATRLHITLVGGSHFRIAPDGSILNTSLIVDPDGTHFYQTKNVLTQWELEPWKLRPGGGIARLSDPRLAVTICYDAEFPESGRSLAEAGALVQCVPAYTETQRGFQRVRWSCLARAVENQLFVIHSSLVGILYLPGDEESPTWGSSAIIAPSVEPFPGSAIFAETPLNEEGIAVAVLNFESLAAARNSGDVRNWNDRARGDWTIS